MGIVFVGSARYELPLPSSLQKKFSRLSERLGPLTVVASSTDGQDHVFESNGARFIVHARYARWRRLLGRLIWSARQVRRLVEAGDVEVIVAQSPYEGAAALAALQSTPAGRQVALVVEAHADFERAGGARFGRGVAALERLVQGALRAVLRRADAVRVVSDSTEEIVTRIAPNVPQVSFPAWTDIDVFATVSVPRNPGLVLYAGVLTPLKNVHALVDAFGDVAAGHPHARLRLVGEAEDPAYAARLRSEVHRLGLDGRVDIEGPVEQEVLARRMAEAGVLVLPSKSEGLGRVVFEAMATGTPVIGANVGGIPSMVRPGQTGWLVDLADPGALGRALDEALSHPNRTRALGNQAQTFARQFFSTEKYLDGMARLVDVARTQAARRCSPEA